MGKNRIELIARGVTLHSGHLLLCRSSEQGHAFLPGGHVDFAEQARDALVRELHEEAGLPVRAGPLLGVCESAFTQDGKHGPRAHHEVNLVFLLTPTKGRLARPAGKLKKSTPPPVISREDHIEFFWAPLADLRSTPKRKAKVRVLPEGIVELALKNIRSKSDSRWLTAWNDD